MRQALWLLAPAAFLSAANAQTELRYWLWDSNQQPAYEQCAVVFEEQHPDIRINIEQLGWGEYWTGLQTSMVAGDTPDVFTNYVVYAREFADKGQLVDLAPLVEQDGIDTSQYVGASAELWEFEQGRYGLPKDWDGIAIAYNADLFEKAGVDVSETQGWTFNPDDGGSFGNLVARLTLDQNGNNGLSPDFDKNNVAQYGFITEALEPHGNNSYSPFALSNGFEYGSGENFNFDDPILARTLEFLQEMMQKGFAPPAANVMGLGSSALFQAGQGALTVVGSWQINEIVNADISAGFLPIPAGSEGRQILSNSLGDSIAASSENQEQAWEWVKFLASSTCQEIVGSYGAVLPAIASGTEAALATFEERGVDISAFTEVAEGQEDSLNYFPVTPKAAEMNAIMAPVLDSIFLGQADPAEALQSVNERVNSLFQ